MQKSLQVIKVFARKEKSDYDSNPVFFFSVKIKIIAVKKKNENVTREKKTNKMPARNPGKP